MSPPTPVSVTLPPPAHIQTKDPNYIPSQSPVHGPRVKWMMMGSEGITQHPLHPNVM